MSGKICLYTESELFLPHGNLHKHITESLSKYPHSIKCLLNKYLFLAYGFTRGSILSKLIHWVRVKKMRNETLDRFIVRMDKAITHRLVSSRRVRISLSPNFLFARLKPLLSEKVLTVQ